MRSECSKIVKIQHQTMDPLRLSSISSQMRPCRKIQRFSVVVTSSLADLDYFKLQYKVRICLKVNISSNEVVQSLQSLQSPDIIRSDTAGSANHLLGITL